MSKSIGYDLNDAFFYVRGRTNNNVIRMTSLSQSVNFSIYPGNLLTSSYNIGVDSTTYPVFWIGRVNDKIFVLDGQQKRVGVGTASPQATLDVYSPTHDTALGRFITDASQATLELAATSAHSYNLGVSSLHFWIGRSNNKLLTLESGTGDARFASNVYVGNTLYANNINVQGIMQTINQTVYNSERLFIDNADDGPAMSVRQSGAYDVATFRSDNDYPALTINKSGYVGIGTTAPVSALHVNGATIQHMGNLNKISVCMGQVPVSAVGTHELGFLLTWAADAASERDMIHADVVFYGSGPQTRTYMRFVQFINPVNNGTTLPGADILIDYKHMKYKPYPNIKFVKGAIVRAGSRSVRVKVIWRSDVAINYNVNMTAEFLAPRSLGYTSVDTFYARL